MKHLIIFMLLALCLKLNAQQYTYKPFPTNNAIWSEKYLKWNTTNQNYDVYYNKFALTGEDTLMHNKVYKKLYYFTRNTFIKDSAICFGGLREDSLKRVYYIGFTDAQSITPTPVSLNQEKLLYDFSLNVGDKLYNIIDSSIMVASIDTVLIGGIYRKQFSFMQYFTDSINQHRLLNTLKWVEGIGCINNGLYYFSLDEFIVGGEDDDNRLLCFTQHNQSVYIAPNVKNCFPITGIDIMLKPTSYAQIFPNPTISNFTVSSINSTIKCVKIINLTGQLVLENNLSNLHQNQINIDASLLKTGLYQCVIELANGQSSTQRLVKE